MMNYSKVLGFLVVAFLMISFTVAQSPAPAPSHGGGRRISPVAAPKKSTTHAPAISPSPVTAVTPESSASPPSPPQADSPSDSPGTTPSTISDSPSQAPGPVQSGAVSNSFAMFGSLVVMLTAAVLAM
ncbi:hypothetical protein AALP_AA8G475500 [Arabis alpina]|uniref:Arabinogalactan protein n=1 Tax=Arabis alpina TaxID=50452 RepID=A0A087GE21_ARAAL|nr:hypothetical protein AALP_AA8G475500 [Arabis alpina]